MVFQCVLISLKDYYVNTNYNFHLFGYRMVIVLQFNFFLNHSGMVLALSKGPEPPKRIWKEIKIEHDSFPGMLFWKAPGHGGALAKFLIASVYLKALSHGAIQEWS